MNVIMCFDSLKMASIQIGIITLIWVYLLDCNLLGRSISLPYHYMTPLCRFAHLSIIISFVLLSVCSVIAWILESSEKSVSTTWYLLLMFMCVCFFWFWICSNPTKAWIMQELIDVEGDGMADMVFRCIQEMDIDNRMMVLIFWSMKIIWTSLKS